MIEAVTHLRPLHTSMLDIYIVSSIGTLSQGHMVAPTPSIMQSSTWTIFYLQSKLWCNQISIVLTVTSATQYPMPRQHGMQTSVSRSMTWNSTCALNGNTFASLQKAHRRITTRWQTWQCNSLTGPRRPALLRTWKSPDLTSIMTSTITAPWIPQFSNMSRNEVPCRSSMNPSPGKNSDVQWISSRMEKQVDSWVFQQKLSKPCAMPIYYTFTTMSRASLLALLTMNNGIGANVYQYQKTWFDPGWGTLGHCLSFWY